MSSGVKVLGRGRFWFLFSPWVLRFIPPAWVLVSWNPALLCPDSAAEALLSYQLILCHWWYELLIATTKH